MTLLAFLLDKYLIARYTSTVHVISRKTLIKFWEKYPDSKLPLRVWFRKVYCSKYKTFNELRKAFLTADKVGNKIVFNIGGNKYRLITSIHFNRAKVYIRAILTHRAYDKGEWKND